MEFNFFGNEFEVKIRKSDKEINKVSQRKNVERIKLRLIFLMLSFIMFSLINGYYKHRTQYEVGNIAKTDIIANKTVKYKQDILDEKLKAKIIANTIPEYDIRDDIASEQIDRFKKVLADLKMLDLKDEKAIKEFITNNLLDIKDEDVIKVGINTGSKYHIYLTDVLIKVYEEGIVKKSDFNKILSKEQIVLDLYEKNLIMNFIKPNLILNEEKTKAKINENMNALKNNIITIHKGDFVVKKGEEITKISYDRLDKLGLVNSYNKTVSFIFSVVFSIGISLMIILSPHKTLNEGIKSKGFYPSLLSFISLNLIYLLATIKFDLIIYLIPIAVISIITNTLTKNKIFAILISTLTNILFAPNIEWFIVMMIISILAIITNEKLTSRIDLVKNGFKIGALQALFAVIYALIYNFDISKAIIMLSFSLISGFLTGVISLGIIPYFENAFNILTDIKLLEIGDYSFPLLKRLLLEAPGTFYHSIMVGALAEQAAEAIGANPILARVGAYYHDIGKLKRPSYFVENQSDGVNLHDELKPSLSALLLTSHPKDGFILGKKYGLPEEVLNIIIEHHGTTMVQFFYYKAVEVNENINETDFRYVGPKPSTKESAIVMLADTVEAAIRASKDKSKEGIENTIRYLIKYKIDDNQLNNCDIELRDIEKIVETFLTVLKAAYHERIQYPKINKK